MTTHILINPRHLGLLAIIDDEDAERVLLHPWTMNGRGYPITTIYGHKTRQTIALHRFVLNNPPYEVDHRNRNKLDCRKENLRPSTRGGNNQNKGKHGSGNTSQYKGVYWHKVSGKWAAQIRVNHRSIHLGVFTSEEEAARIYDWAAHENHGEFAYLNFQEEPSQ